MKKNEAVYYDEAADVLYIVSEEGKEEEFIEISPGINMELDKDGTVIGVEILNASKLLGSVAEPLRKKSTQN
ncbi:DUF2283 domain-containing protein [Candidatus Bipolaricaulota bacterium]|nr:DUF2283 domain-containing protein [Candidatus Bipolaricaulota bacterium]